MSLKGKVAWITGGGSGIDLAGGLELVKAGAHVVISGHAAATNALAKASVEAGVHAGFAGRGVRDTFAEDGSTPFLFEKYGLIARAIVAAADRVRRQA